MTTKNGSTANVKNTSKSKEGNITENVAVEKTSDLDKSKIQIPQFIALESTLGAITILAMKSQSHKYLFTSDLEWLVIPPVAQKQFALFRNSKNEPISFISWANIDEETEKRLLSGSLKLQPRDWNGGNKKYVIDVISPFAPAKEILKEFQEKKFKDEEIRILRPKKDGKGFEAVLLQEFLA
jgi:cytolysin-activating lysine-acyltransferase